MLIPTTPPKPPKRGGAYVRSCRTAGNEKAVPLRSGDLRDFRQPKCQAEGGRPTRVLRFPTRIGGAGSMVPRSPAYGEAAQGAHPPTCQCPPSPGGRCSAPKNMLEGEGSTVPRRTVCGRRPWSEALAGGGPSIPLPTTRQEEPPFPPMAKDTSRAHALRYPAHRVEPRRTRRSAVPDSDTDRPRPV